MESGLWIMDQGYERTIAECGMWDGNLLRGIWKWEYGK